MSNLILGIESHEYTVLKVPNHINVDKYCTQFWYNSIDVWYSIQILKVPNLINVDKYCTHL